MKRKRLAILLIGFFSAVSLSACQKTKEDRSDDINENQADQPVTEAFSYTGEYNDYDNDEPNLQIRENDDGTYLIQIGIFRLASMDDCTGYETENGLEFTVNDWDWGNGEISGIITLEGEIATVTFTAGWNESGNEYQYHKTSDIPTIR